MTEPRKLREGSDFSAGLLRAGRHEVPQRGSQRRVAAGLGLLASVPTAANASALAAKATGSVLTAGSGGTSLATGSLVAKWLAIGVAAGAGTIGTAEWRSATESEARPPATITVSAQTDASRTERMRGTVASPPVPAPALTPVLAPAPTPAPAAAALSPTPAAARPGAATGRRPASLQDSASSAASAAAGRLPATSVRTFADAAGAAPPPSIAEEIATLDLIRSAIGRGDGQTALGALDANRAQLRVLALEAQLLRVEALLLVGQRAAAERVSEQLAREHPGSPHVARARRLLGRR